MNDFDKVLNQYMYRIWPLCILNTGQQPASPYHVDSHGLNNAVRVIRP